MERLSCWYQWVWGWAHTVLIKIHIILINQTLKSRKIVPPPKTYGSCLQSFGGQQYLHSHFLQTKPGTVPSEQPQTKGRYLPNSCFPADSEKTAATQAAHLTLSRTAAKFLFFFSLKCLLGIKPELSSTASVICNHKLTCDEKKLAKKRKKKIRKSNCSYSRCKEISLCSKMGEKQNTTSCFPVTVYTTAAVSALLCKRCGYLSESNLHQMSSRNEQFRCVIGTKLCEQMNDSSVVHLELADASCFSTLNFFVDLGFISLAG